MKDYSLFSSVGFSSGLARGWEGSQPGPRLEKTAALVVPPVGAHPFLCLCKVRLKLYLRIVLLYRHNPAAMRSCCGGKRGFRQPREIIATVCGRLMRVVPRHLFDTWCMMVISKSNYVLGPFQGWNIPEYSIISWFNNLI